MSFKQKHIIQRVTLELDLESPAGEVYALQQALKDSLYRTINEQLAPLLSGFSTSDTLTRIPKLEVNLGELSKEKLTRNFEKSCIEALEEKLRSLLQEYQQKHTFSNPLEGGGVEPKSGQKLTQLPVKKVIKEDFIHFLKTGRHLSIKVDWETWEKQLLKILLDTTPADLKEWISNFILTHPYMLDRLLWQFSMSFVKNLYGHLISATPNPKELIPFSNSEAITELDLYHKRFALLLLNEHVQLNGGRNSPAKKDDSPTSFTDFNRSDNEKAFSVNEEKAGLNDTTEINLEYDKTGHNEREIKDLWFREQESSFQELYISNAGLVLVIPFVKILFKELNYLNLDGTFIDDLSRFRAVHLLQFLAEGENQQKEHQLTLNKLVCGIPLSKPIPGAVILTQKEQEEADSLLRTVIGHWGILKNTSVDGLRYNFLFRAGKLVQYDTYWYLIVEKKDFDTYLLGKLPWGISLIKQQWMKKRIQVDWI